MGCGRQLKHRADERKSGLRSDLRDLDDRSGDTGEPADQLRELVRGVCVLHLGRRVPASEAEWEYAAAGGSQELEYPWGSTVPGTTNLYAIYGWHYTGNSTTMAPVGFASLGVARWGPLDMAGEVDEWNLDWDAAYASCTDCADTTAGSFRIIRGGGFHDLASTLLVSLREFDPPSSRHSFLGFRCARTP